MKANFDISLPSIPGKNIKFKIQDIKSTAFGAQKARFPDNKSLLTRKFVESFSNFHEPPPTKINDDDQDTQAGTQYLERSRIQRETKFRTMVSDNKKFLIPVFNKMRKAEQSSIFEDNIDKNKGKINREGVSYSFGRAGLDRTQDQEENSQVENYSENQDSSKAPITDNYYFSADQNQIRREQEQKVKKPRPSAVFKNETRKRFEDRFYSSTNPGPGAYLKKEEAAKSTKKQQARKIQDKRVSEDMDYKRLKQVITSIVAESPAEDIQDEVKDSFGEKDIKNDHMFVLDDRDRFGKQAFPIATRTPVPGPGAYEIGDTLQERAKKILLVEEQRKLLKEWFNN